MGSKGREWHATFFSQFPWSGFLAVFCAAIFTFLASFILKYSHGQPVSTWRLSPTVFLALLSAGTNALLRFAFSEGATISWWNQAIHGTTVKELHRSFTYSEGLLPLIWPPLSKFNFVRLAGLAVGVLVIDGPLLQRASTVQTVRNTVTTGITLPIRIQPMWNLTTTWKQGNAYNFNLYQPELEDVVRESNNHDPITVPTGICNGTCNSNVTVAGFDRNCITSRTHREHIPWGPRARSLLNSSDPVVKGWYDPVFQIDMYYRDNNLSTMAYIRDQVDANDTLLTYDCHFQTAFITINLKITNSTVSIQHDRSSHNRTVEIYDDVHTAHFSGGFFKALEDIYGGVVLFDMPHQLYKFAGSNTRSYVNQTTLYVDPAAWIDPIPDLLDRLDELSLRYAMKTIPNTPDRMTELKIVTETWLQAPYPPRSPRLALSPRQTVPAVQSSLVVVYHSNYVFLIIALTIMLVTATSVGSTMLGWWNLGREVTLSPVEVAKAFDAPLLSDAGSNMQVEEIVNTVGALRIQYGVPPMGQQQLNEEIQGSPATKLSMLRTEDAGRPRNGMVYL